MTPENYLLRKLQISLPISTYKAITRAITPNIFGALMKLKNIAIVAHVDHGKTTLVDEIPEKRASRVRFKIKEKYIVDINWEQAQDEMIDLMEKFESIFRPEVKSIGKLKAA